MAREQVPSVPAPWIIAALISVSIIAADVVCG